MTSLSFRAYFVLVGLFALWVGAWGLLVPAEVGRALPWTVPPLHARFLGAFYLGALVAMALALRASSAVALRLPIALAALWTGLLLLVSLLHLDAFDFAKPQVAFWMGAYAVYPVWGAWLYVRAARAAPAQPGAVDPALAAIALLALAFGAALLVAPAAMVAAWPWKVTPLLVQVYAGPFLAYGATTLMAAREARPEARRIVLASLATFSALALVASLLHRALFRFDAPAAWLWFAGLAATSAVAALRLGAARRRA